MELIKRSSAKTRRRTARRLAEATRSVSRFSPSRLWAIRRDRSLSIECKAKHPTPDGGPVFTLPQFGKYNCLHGERRATQKSRKSDSRRRVAVRHSDEIPCLAGRPVAGSAQVRLWRTEAGISMRTARPIAVAGRPAFIDFSMPTAPVCSWETERATLPRPRVCTT